jgi:hypothetical protein
MLLKIKNLLLILTINSIDYVTKPWLKRWNQSNDLRYNYQKLTKVYFLRLYSSHLSYIAFFEFCKAYKFNSRRTSSHKQKKVVKMTTHFYKIKGHLERKSFIKTSTTYFTNNSRNTTLLQHPTNTMTIATADFIFIIMLWTSDLFAHISEQWKAHGINTFCSRRT